MKGGRRAKAFLVNGRSRWPGDDWWEEGLGPSRQHVQGGLCIKPGVLACKAKRQSMRLLTHGFWVKSGFHSSVSSLSPPGTESQQLIVSECWPRAISTLLLPVCKVIWPGEGSSIFM